MTQSLDMLRLVSVSAPGERLVSRMKAVPAQAVRTITQSSQFLVFYAAKGTGDAGKHPRQADVGVLVEGLANRKPQPHRVMWSGMSE
jgi:hypothetical protein